GHRFLDDLQEMDALLLGEQVGQLVIRRSSLVIVEDRNLFHAAVEDAPAGAQARRRLFHAGLLHFGSLGNQEFVASRADGDGVLILSRFAGPSRELTGAVLMNPFAIGEIADAIHTALKMPDEERRKRMTKMRAAVAENNIFRWAGKFLSTLLKFEFPENGRSEVELFLERHRSPVSPVAVK